VAAQDDTALEPQEEMLADGLHPLEHETVDRGGDPGDPPARVRRLRLDAVADQRAEPLGGTAQRVTFRHSYAPSSSVQK
jgi:hypothetical protein